MSQIFSLNNYRFNKGETVKHPEHGFGNVISISAPAYRLVEFAEYDESNNLTGTIRVSISVDDLLVC